MGKRSYSGGTTALVIVLTLVIILIGVGFFFWMKIIGGGNELQHATDSGNLNVAKQALISPTTPLTGATESNEFGDLVDPNNNNVDLLVFDRLVGKSVIVALNAAVEGTPQAKSNAQAVYNMVEGQNSIGSRLADALSQHKNLAGFFSNLSTTNSTRMLHTDGQITADPNETAVAYMARSKASNVYINSNQVPNGSSFLSGKGNIVSKNGKQYISGYDLLDCGLAGVNPQAVPMRPGEQPHLVDVNDFQQLISSPLGGASSQIPPNAFRSGGIGVEGNQTNANLTMRSCALIGTLNQDFPIALPRGYIIVDNSGSVKPFSGTTGGGNSTLGSIMMQPSYVGLVPGTPSGDIIGGPGAVQAVENYVNDPSKQPPVPQSMLSAIDSPSNLTSDQAYSALKAPQNGSPPAVHQCNNVNSISMGPGPFDPSCQQDYNKFLQIYGKTVPPTQTTTGDLMAVEAFKCYVLQARASVGSGGCQSATAPATCTGLKSYDINGQYCLPCNFASPGTLSQLLTEAPGASALASTSQPLGDLITRMYQIKPTAQPSEIQSVLDSTVAFGTVSYIYLQGGPNDTLTLSSSPPSFPINTSSKPDGAGPVSAAYPNGTPPFIFDTGTVNLDGKIVNVPSCEGYPNPWDCPALPASGQNKILWTPSSGYSNLLGVLQFVNCANGGGDWCCPC